MHQKYWNGKIKYIPSHYPNANTDIESSYKLIEEKLHGKELFSSVKGFINKDSFCQSYFNLLRKNS